MILSKLLREHKGISVDDLTRLESLEYAAKTAVTAKNKPTFKAITKDILKLLMADNYTDNQYNVITSNTKSQQQYPFDSVNLSRRGLVPFRVMYSHYAHEMRGPIKNFEIHTNFLDDRNRINRLISEMNRLPISVHKLPGVNILKNLDINHFAQLRHLISDPDLDMAETILKFMNRSDDLNAEQLYYDNTLVQRVHNKPDDGDEQKDLHSDIFFPAMKFWYFPEAVTADDGPFEFIPESTEVTYPLLEYWYLESIKVAQGHHDKSHGRGHYEGSIRLKVGDIDRIGEGKWNLTKMIVPADTLLIGNVFGFHRRGDVTKEHTRIAVHGSVRVPNPFD